MPCFHFFRADEFFLQGHYPGNPVVPGVILCEIMGQSCSLLVKEYLQGKTPYFTGIDKTRFKRPVYPGDTIEVTGHITSHRAMLFFIDAQAKVNGKLCVKGKVALVTGAARGIGKAIAYKLAQAGADIAFTDLNADENFNKTVEEISALGVTCRGYASNAADFQQAHDTVEQIHKDFGRIDILVNNAGITRDGLMMRMTEQQWDMVINVNLKSAFNFTHALVPIMARQRGGSIINISSIVGVNGNAGQCNYSASKAGMIGLAKSIAREMGSRGIRANAIAPGFIITEMTNALSEEVREEWNKKIPLRRGGTPEDIANVALFLASDLSSYVTGQVIVCDGGMI